MNRLLQCSVVRGGSMVWAGRIESHHGLGLIMAFDARARARARERRRRKTGRPGSRPRHHQGDAMDQWQRRQGIIIIIIGGGGRVAQVA